ncbi:MAG: antitoxin MazE-like protein [Solirubrobacteraceae bacterium]
MAKRQTRAIRERVAAHRERLRREGLRPVQLWVPDARAPGFAAEAHRQSALAAASANAAEDQAFVDAISWFGDEDGEDGA